MGRYLRLGQTDPVIATRIGRLAQRAMKTLFGLVFPKKSLAPFSMVSYGNAFRRTSRIRNYTMVFNDPLRIITCLILIVTLGLQSGAQSHAAVQNGLMLASHDVPTANTAGDIDHNGAIEIADAILALKSVLGSGSQSLHSDADVNKDGKIGTPEVLFILQVLSGLRDWDPVLPTVMATSPAVGAIDVYPNTSVGVQFNEPLQPSSVSGDTCLIQMPGGALVSGTVTLDQDVITFTPLAPFSFDTEYTVVLKTGIKDLDGSAMPDDFIFSFTTEASQPITVTVIEADASGLKLRLDPAVAGLLPADIGVSADGENFVSPESISTADNGETYTVMIPLEVCNAYTLRLNKYGYAFGGDGTILPTATVNAAVSQIGVSGFNLILDPPIPQLTAQEVTLVPQGTAETQPAGAAVTNDGGETYRIHVPLAHDVTYTLNLQNDCFQISTPPVVQVPIPTLTGTIANLSYDRHAGHYVFDIRTDIELKDMHYTLHPEEIVILDEDGLPVAVSGFEPIIYNGKYIAFRVTASLRHGMTHLVDLYAPAAPYFFAGAEITTSQVVTFEVADAWIGYLTLVTDLPLHGLGPEHFEVWISNPYAAVAVVSVATSSDGLTHTIYAPVDLHTAYTVRLMRPGYSFYPAATGSDEFSIGLRYVTVTVSDPTLDGFTIGLDNPVQGLTLDEFELLNLDGPDPMVDSIAAEDNGATYQVRTRLETLSRYTIGFTRYGYHCLPANLFISPEPPTANDDAPGSSAGYTTVHDANLTVTVASGLLSNDILGIPKAGLTSFGGGSLGGTVQFHNAGASASLAGGILKINGDGSFSLSGQPLIPGTYTVDYRLTNDSGFSDASLTIHVQERPAVLATFPVPGTQNVAAGEEVRIQMNNEINPATVNVASFEVTQGGEQVAGAIEVIDDTLVFRPAALLALNTIYTVVLNTGIKDVNGNSMSGDYSFTFKTAGAPELLSTDPAPGAKGVAVDQTISLSFNNTIDPSTVNAASVELTLNGVPLAGVLEVLGNTLLFTPSIPLGFDARYTVILKSGIKDMNGAFLPGDYIFAFNTVLQPSVLTTNPAPGADDVLIESDIRVSFNHDIDPTTASNDFEVTHDGESVDGTLLVVGNTITFTPSAFFAFDTLYSVTLRAGIKDVNGVSMPAPHMFTFRTVALPKVVTTDPDSGAENVATGSNVRFWLNNLIDAASVDASSFAITQSGEAVAGAIEVIEKVITFTPSAPFEFDTLYTMILKAGIKDLHGTPLPEDYHYTFRTVILPEVLTAEPSPDAEDVSVDGAIHITFNNQIDPATIDPSTFKIIQDSVPFTGTLEVVGNTITFTPSVPLAFDREYTVTIKAGIKDVYGTRLPGDFTFTFRTIAQPIVISSDPIPGTEDVLVDGVISVTFNKAIDPASVNTAVFTVTRNGEPVPGIVDVNNKTIMFTPSSPLELETLYTVTLQADIRDMNGNSMSGDYSFPLKTASLRQIGVSVFDANQYGLGLRLEPPVHGLLPDNFGISADGITFVPPQAVSTSDHGETYNISIPLVTGATYQLHLEKPGNDFGSDVPVATTMTVDATISKIGVSGFNLALDPPLPHLTPQEVRLAVQGATDPRPVGALETTDGGATYRVYYPLIPDETYTLDIHREGLQITVPPVMQVPEPTFTGAITNVVFKAYNDVYTAQYEFDLRININPPTWTYNLQANDITILDEDGTPMVVSQSEIGSWHSDYIIFKVTADLKHGMAHLVDVHAPHVPYTFAGAQIETSPYITLTVEKAVIGEFTIRTDYPLPELAIENISLVELGDTPVAVHSVTSSSDGFAHIVKAPVQMDTYYKATLNGLPGYRFSPSQYFLTGLHQITLSVLNATTNSFTLGLSSPVDGLVSAELELKNLDGLDPTVESIATEDNGRTYYITTQLKHGNRYQINLEKWGYLSDSLILIIDLVPPTAIDDTPGPGGGYNTPNDDDLSVDAGLGLIDNDSLGAPAASLSSFGGGSLGGVVTDYSAGTSVSLAGGNLLVNGDGSFSLTGQPFTPGTYNFDYRIANDAGTSDATVAIQVQQRPAVLATTPTPGYQGTALTKAIRISLNNPVDPATVDNTTLEVTRNSQLVAGTLEVVGSEIIFSPTTPYDLDSIYKVDLKTAVKDINGNSLADDFSFTFRTATLPALQTTFPAPETENAPIDGTVQMSLNNPIDPTTVDASTIEVTLNGEPVAGTIHVIDNDIIFTPSAFLGFDTIYTVFLNAGGIRDENGNPISGDYTFTFKTAGLQQLSVSVLDASVTGLELHLDPPIPDLLPTNIGISTDGVIFGAPQAVISTDHGANYTVTIPLEAGGRYLLRVNKPGYEFNTHMSIEPIAIVDATVSNITVSGFTLALDPPLPYLKAREVWLNTQVTSDMQPARALETTDGGATYRVIFPLAFGEIYALELRNDRYPLDTTPIIQMPTPSFDGSITEVSPEYGFFRLRLNTAEIQQGDYRWSSIKPKDFSVLDEAGLPVEVTDVQVSEGGYTGLTYVLLFVGTDLKNGMKHLVDVRVPGETFAGVEITTTQKVIVDVDPDNKAVVGEFTIHTDLPLSGLSPANIDLKEYYSPHTPIAIQSVKTSPDGRTHIVNAPIQLETWYEVSLAGMSGYRFDCSFCLVRPSAQYIEVTVEDETPYGFTLALKPAVTGLTAADLRLTNLDGPDPIVESLVSDDGGQTYQVTAQLQNWSLYVAALEAYGYVFPPCYVAFDVINIHHTELTNARHDGFSLKFSQPVDGLINDNFTLRSQVTGHQVPIAAIAATNGGATYQFEANLIPGHVYRIDFARPGYTDEYQLIYPPEADLRVSDLTRNGFTLSIQPLVPGLVPGDLKLSFNTDSFTRVNVPITGVISTDNGATYVVDAKLPEDEICRLEIPVMGGVTGRYVGRSSFYAPRLISWSINEVFPDRMVLEFSDPVNLLRPHEVVMLDAHGDEWQADYVAATDQDGYVHSVLFSIPVDQSYSVDVRAVRVARVTLSHENEYWQFVGPAPEILVPNWVAVDVSVSRVTAGEVTLTLSPAVSSLESENIELVSVADRNALPINISTPDGGSTYTLTGAYIPGHEYAFQIERPGYQFGLPKAFSIGTPPLLTGAWTDTEGSTIFLRFDKDMAEPPDAPAGFTLTEDGVAQTIQDVTLSSEDPRFLHIHLGQTVGTGALSLSYAPAALASTDAGPLEIIEDTPIANQRTLLGTAFVQALKGQTVAEVATTLVTRFAIDANGLIPSLLAIGYGPSELAEAWTAALFIDANQVAGMLAGEGYDTRAITKALLDVNQDDPVTLTSALAGIGKDAPAVAAELRWAFHTTSETSAALLRDAGYDLLAVTNVLRSTFAQTAGETAVILVKAGFEPSNVAGVLEAAYPFNLAEIAAALRENGVDAMTVAAMLKTFTVQEDSPAALGQTLRHGGFETASVAAALEALYGNTAEVLKASIEAGLLVETAGQRLKEVWGLNISNAHNLLLAVDPNHLRVIESLREAYGLDAIVAFAYNTGWPALMIANDILAHFSATPSQMVNALLLAGYPLVDAAKVLRSVYRVDGGVTGELVIAAYGADDAELVAGMRGADFDATEVTRALVKRYGRWDHEAEIVAALKSGGFSVEDITTGMAAVLLEYFSIHDTISALREAGGYSLAEVMQGLRTVGIKFDLEMVGALCEAGYAVHTVLDAWIDQTNATPADVVRLRHQQSLCHYCDLPGWSGSDAAVVFVSRLQALFPTVDPAEARKMVLDALRQGEFDADSAAQAVRDTLGDPGAEVMLSDLLHAGYPENDTLELIKHKYGLFNESSLITLAFRAGFSPIGAADYLRGYSILSVVRILAEAGLSAQDVAVVLRQYHEATASEALGYLELVGCPHSACYNWVDVTAAVQTAYTGSDPLSLTVQRMQGEGSPAHIVAKHLRKRFGLDITGAATALRQGGYLQSDVMYGIFKAFIEESALTAHSPVWGLPQSHHELRQVLEDVFFVTTRLDQLYGLIDVARRDNVVWDEYPIRNTLSFLRQGPYDLNDIVLVMKELIPYDEQIFTNNGAHVLDYLFENLGPFHQDGYSYTAIRAAVDNKYGQIDAADWAKVKLHLTGGAAASDLTAMVRTRFLEEDDDPLDAAAALQSAGWSLEDILTEVAIEYYDTNRTQLDALILQGLDQASGIQNLAALLVELENSPVDIYDTLQQMFPTASRGDVIASLLGGGVLAGELEAAMIRSPGWWIDAGNPDDSIADILPEFISNVHDANWLLRHMGYSLDARLERLTDPSSFAFEPHIVMHNVRDDLLDMTIFFRSMGVPARQIAEGIRNYYVTWCPPSLIAETLWKAGYTREQIVAALAPPEIAFPPDGLIPEGQFRGVSLLDLFWALKLLIEDGAFTAADIVRDLGNLKPDLSLFDLIEGVYYGLGARQAYQTIQAIQDMNQWIVVANTLSHTGTYKQIVAIHVLHQFGEDANYAAILTFDQITSWPALGETHLILHQAGYDYWTARNAAKWAHGWFEPEYWLNAARGVADESFWDRLQGELLGF